jgi:hypothetical protein
MNQTNLVNNKNHETNLAEANFTNAEIFCHWNSFFLLKIACVRKLIGVSYHINAVSYSHPP